MKTIFTTSVFDAWLAKLRDKIAVAKIKARMDRLEMGNLGDAKFVGEGIMIASHPLRGWLPCLF